MEGIEHMPLYLNFRWDSGWVKFVKPRFIVITFGERPYPATPDMSEHVNISILAIFGEKVVFVFEFSLPSDVVGDLEAHKQLDCFEDTIFDSIVTPQELFVQFCPFRGLASGIDHQVTIVY